MEELEVSGRTVEEAIEEALEESGLSREEVEYWMKVNPASWGWGLKRPG